MVTFAPTIPDTPGYPFQSDQSHSISEPSADISKELAYKGAASALGDVVAVAEDYTKQSILTKTHFGLDNINNEAIDRLNEAKANPELIAMKDSQNQPTPEAVKGLPKTLDALDQARANNKISQTYIDMQKDALAKSLRAQYPGHRELVDEIFAKSSREDPANRYISSLIGDINSLATAAGEKRNATRTLAIDGLKTFPSSSGWDKIANQYFAGQIPDDKLRSAFFRYSSQKADREEAEHSLHFDDEFRKDIKARATQFATEISGQNARNFYYNHTFSTAGLNTAASMAETLRKASSGEITLTPDQKAGIAQELVAARAAYIQDTITELNTSKDKSKPSIATLATTEETMKIVENNAKLYFDPLIDQVTHDKFGLMGLSQATVKAIESDTLHELFTDPDKEFARYNRTLAALGKNLTADQIGKLAIGGLGRNYDVKYWNFIQQKHLGGLAGDTPDPDTPGAMPPSIRAEAAKIKSTRASDDAKKAMYIDLIKDANDIADKTIPDENKRNAVARYFDPRNKGLISQFDKRSGIQVFKDMTSEPITKEVHKLGGKSWAMYQSWVKDTFGTELFPGEIRDINAIGNLPVNIAWDSEKHQFKAEGTEFANGPRGRGVLVNKIDLPEVTQVKASVDRLNKGLQTLSSVSHYSGEDTNVYMYKLLVDSGLQGPIVDMMRKAIINANTKPQAQE